MHLSFRSPPPGPQVKDGWCLMDPRSIPQPHPQDSPKRLVQRCPKRRVQGRVRRVSKLTVRETQRECRKASPLASVLRSRSQPQPAEIACRCPRCKELRYSALLWLLTFYLTRVLLSSRTDSYFHIIRVGLGTPSKAITVHTVPYQSTSAHKSPCKDSRTHCKICFPMFPPCPAQRSTST